MAYYQYIDMNSLQSEEAIVLENIYLILNNRWNYGEVEETKKMVKMFEDSEEVIARCMSIEEIDIRNRMALTFLPLSEKEKRLGMIENPEKWIAEIDEQKSSSWGTLNYTSEEMVKALAKFFLKIAVYRFCTVYWPKLACQNMTIDEKRIKTLRDELEHWEFCFWIDPLGIVRAKQDMFAKRKQLLSFYAEMTYGGFDGGSIVEGWIDKAYKDCKDKVIYENAKKLRLKYTEENGVIKRKDERGDRKISEIENMRKMLDIMERHLCNNLTPQDIADLRENMQSWEKNIEKLSEMINNLSDFDLKTGVSVKR